MKYPDWSSIAELGRADTCDKSTDVPLEYGLAVFIRDCDISCFLPYSFIFDMFFERVAGDAVFVVNDSCYCTHVFLSAGVTPT